MHIDYVKQLFHNLNKIQVSDKEGNIFCDYEVAIQKLLELFLETKQDKKQVFFIGNGGSAAIASHMTADFMKNGNMRTCCLYDSSAITCMANDYGYSFGFSKQLELLGDEGDLLVAISSSGNSDNIVNAVQVAQQKQMKVITFSGFEENNKIKRMGTYNLYVPVCHYGMVESIHNLVLQQIVDTILEQDSI